MPPNVKPYATWEEYEAFVREITDKPSFPFALEWMYAREEGWDPVKYQELYKDYVRSTQITRQPGNDITELKGRPLERLARYFLEKGGFARNVRELSAPQQWQIDGQGVLNKTVIRMCWGDDLCQQVGVHMYMEAKNHKNPATNDEFSLHYQKMEDHGCKIGIFVSTCGFSIGRGQGIAHTIYHHFLRGIFHLLLVFESFRSVITDRKAPLAVLQEVLVFAMNDEYATNPKLQTRYSAQACREAAKEVYLELFPD